MFTAAYKETGRNRGNARPGIAAAKHHDAKGRMPPGQGGERLTRVLDSAELAALRHLVDDGVFNTEAARILKISHSTAYAALAADLG